MHACTYKYFLGLRNSSFLSFQTSPPLLPVLLSSHSLRYHPEVYKTTGCDAYRRAGGCRRGDYCAFIHPGDQLVEVSRRAFKREPYGEHSDRSIAEGEAKGSWAEPAPVPGEGGGEPMAIPVPADGAGSEDDCGLGPPSAVAGQQETWFVRTMTHHYDASL